MAALKRREHRADVLPLMALAILALLGLRGDMLMATVICAAAPPAAIVAMLAENCGRDPVLASGVVSFHTLLSVITMPVVGCTARDCMLLLSMGESSVVKWCSIFCPSALMR